MVWSFEFMSPRVICFNDGNSAGAAETKKHFTKLPNESRVFEFLLMHIRIISLELLTVIKIRLRTEKL